MTAECPWFGWSVRMDAATKTHNSGEILEAACARNASVELHQFGIADGVLVARSRLLGLDDRCVYLDTPKSYGPPLSLDRGKIVSVFMLLSGKRHEFKSRVVQPRCTVNLNASTTVRGISLSRPKRIQEGQRREDYRILVAALDPIAVHFHEVPEGDVNQCPVDIVRFSGRLIDLSRGGFCARVDVTERAKFAPDEEFFIQCRFPEDLGEITRLACARHSCSIAHGEAHRVGFRFLPWCPKFTKPQEHIVVRFCAEQERQSIRRAK